MLECVRTSSVSLPCHSLASPLRPCEDMKIASQRWLSAGAMIALNGWSLWVKSVSNATSAARARCIAGARMPCAIFSDWRLCSSIEITRFDMIVDSFGASYSGTAVNRVTRAPDSRANSMPASTALSAVSEPSVGIRMCSYMGPPLPAEDQGRGERILRCALEQALDQRHVLLLLGRHLARQGAQRRIVGGAEHPLEEGLRAPFRLERDGERLARRHQPENQLARRGLGRTGVEPLVLRRCDCRQSGVIGPALEGFEVLRLHAGEHVEHRRQLVAALVRHPPGKLAIALRGFPLDGDGVGVELLR